MKKKGKKFQRKSSNSLNKLSLFQKSEGRFNRSCPLSIKNAPVIDYKNINLLKKYMSENNKILSSKITSVSTGKQRKLTKEIKKTNSTPIILLTAKGQAEDRIEGLELGADDYLGKPFEPKELALRIKNILNKVNTSILSEEIFIGQAVLDLKKLTIKKNDQITKINPQERKILEKMLLAPGKIFSRDPHRVY